MHLLIIMHNDYCTRWDTYNTVNNQNLRIRLLHTRLKNILKMYNTFQIMVFFDSFNFFIVDTINKNLL